MKKILLFIILLGGTTIVQAQKIPDYGFDRVDIVLADRIIRADLNNNPTNPKPKIDRLYYWYSGNTIQTTQGGYSGRLLNGEYDEYYLNKGLKEQGFFKYGLKSGRWRSWNENGTLAATVTWVKGLRQGPFTVLNGDGEIKQTGDFENGELSGELRNYTGKDSVQVLYYNKGKLLTQHKRGFLNRINMFKKHTD